MAAVMLSGGLLIGASALFLDSMPADERSQLARVPLPQTSPDKGAAASPRFAFQDREERAQAPGPTAPRAPASEVFDNRLPGGDRVPLRQESSPQAQATALSPPSIPDAPLSDRTAEQAPTSEATVEPQPRPSLVTLGPGRYTSQELREAGDDAFRHRNFSAAVELYDRALQALDMENSQSAEHPDAALQSPVRADQTAPGSSPGAGAASPAAATSAAIMKQDGLAPGPLAASETAWPKPDTGRSTEGSAAAGRLSPSAFAALMRNGDAAMQRGDIIGARALYVRAASLDASASNAQIAAGKTYDPVILSELGVSGGALADTTAAVQWYERAQSLGNAAATELLSRLR